MAWPGSNQHRSFPIPPVYIIRTPRTKRISDSQEIATTKAGTLTVVQRVVIHDNVLDKPEAVAVFDEVAGSTENPSSVNTTMSYDDQGRLLTLVDLDQGTFTYTYDPDGHVTTVVQTSSSNSRTLGFNYDLLGRVGCVQPAAGTLHWDGSCTSGPPTLIRNTYDSTSLGTQGSTDFPVGQLTQSLYYTYYPDGSRSGVTYQYQHDQRERLLNAQMEVSVPSGWNVTSALPTYQESMLYNDADQLTTTSTLAGSSGYTFTNVYNATTGVLQGLNNNSSTTANLATLTYNEYAQLGSITYLNGANSSPVSIASEAFSYDGNLRPTSLTANWLPSSGNSGEILGESLAYDNAGNVTSTNTFFPTVSGQSSSGGSETQNFCYDERNRLVWSGNGGTQPGAGTGTCGSGTLANTISGAGYTAPFTYTNLGQLWQGPVNGTGSTQQYLYCNSAPHELSGIYPGGTTCATKGSATASYDASYDPWGNETTRAYNNVTATLSYDAFNRLSEYNAGSSSQEFYAYDANGNRVLKRTINGSTTTIAVYPSSLEEYDYTGTGTLSSQLHYYSLAGHLIGESNGSTTVYNLTDALGSILTSFSQTAVIGQRVYGPYGNNPNGWGTIGTPKGYTGQIHDALTGLDYYNARYYDPVSGQFLSPDSVQGNAQGMDPYAYVAGNPESRIDPSGNAFCAPDSCGRGGGGGDGGPPPDLCKLDQRYCKGDTGCIYRGQPCSSTNNDCDKKTTNWVNGQCVAKPDNSQKKKNARNDKLRLETIAGIGLLAPGGLISILADIYAVKAGLDDGDLLAIIGAIADGISVLSDIIGAIGLINQAAGKVAYVIEAGLHGLLAVVNGVLWAYNLVMSGWKWASGIVTKALQAVGIAVQGVPGELFKLADELFGKSIIAGARMVGHGFMAEGNAALADVAGQEAMNIDDWCAEYGQDQAACTLS